MDELIQVVHVRYHLSFPSKDVSLYSLFDSEHHNDKHTWFLPDLASKRRLIKRLMGWKSRKDEEEEGEEGAEGRDTDTSSSSSCPTSSPIGLLPRPLLLRIFSFLPLLHNIGSVSCVCTKWKRIVETSDALWWRLYKFDWNLDAKVRNE
jgi:hypothetical protein